MTRHLLLFDIDGTLLHAGGAGRVALLRALESAFGIVTPTLEVDFAGRTDRAILSEALALHGLDGQGADFVRYFDEYLTHLPTTLVERPGRILTGVRELLVALAARSDTRLGILTGNVERAAHMKLAHFALDEFFCGGGFGDHHHDRDDVARAAAQALVDHVGDDTVIWVIGDTPADVRCARAIGARAVAVAAGFASREDLVASNPDFLLDDLSDTKAFLRLLDDPAAT